MISGELLKYLNGLRINGRYETRPNRSIHFALTLPPKELSQQISENFWGDIVIGEDLLEFEISSS